MAELLKWGFNGHPGKYAYGTIEENARHNFQWRYGFWTDEDAFIIHDKEEG